METQVISRIHATTYFNLFTAKILWAKSRNATRMLATKAVQQLLFYLMRRWNFYIIQFYTICCAFMFPQQ